MAAHEIGFEVVGLGCYNREFARDLRAAARELGVEPLITDDYLEVEAAIQAAQPELILGTQMERHIGKRARGGLRRDLSAGSCAGLSRALLLPQMGWEGANVLFDSWIHPLTMGLEEHLLHMFRQDPEFHDAAGPSHHGGHAPRGSDDRACAAELEPTPDAAMGALRLVWSADAERELRKVPFFVRGKARRNTEKFAVEQGLSAISVETLYEAKAHYAR